MAEDQKSLTVYRSEDNRYRSDYYSKSGSGSFCIGERTLKGILITEFEIGGNILNQVYVSGTDTEKELKSYLSADIDVKKAEKYDRVKINAVCDKCNEYSLMRNLDLISPDVINEVSVVPIYICTKCGKKFYSMTDRYLRNLVKGNLALFDKDEVEELKKDEYLFINTLQEYIIRIFASKKISRIKIED